MFLRDVSAVLFGFCAVSVSAGVLLNGDMERENILPIQTRAYILSADKKLVPAPKDSAIIVRQKEKFHSGSAALALESDNPQNLTEINVFNVNLPVTGGEKYEFNFHYMLESAEPATRIKIRVTFFGSDRKPLKYYWNAGKIKFHLWQELTQSCPAPQGAVSAGITVWVNGRHKVYIDDMVFRTAVENTKAADKAGKSSALLLETAEFAVFSDEPGAFPERSGRDATSRRSDKIYFDAAANEREAQLLVFYPKRDFAGVKAVFSPLRRDGGGAEIPAGAFNIQEVRFVPSGKNDYSADALVACTDINAAAGRNKVLFLTVDVPAGSKPGTYRGTLRFVGGGVAVGVPLELLVRNFTLPSAPKMKSLFYASPVAARNQYNDTRSLNAVADDLAEILRDHRITGNQGALPAMPEWKLTDGKVVVTDWSKFDAYVERYNRIFGQNVFIVPKIFMLGDSSGGWFKHIHGDYAFGASALSPEGLSRMCDFAAALDKHVKERFPGIAFYCYLYDEPHHTVWNKLNLISSALKKAAPGLQFFYVTVFPDDVKNIDIWCNAFGPSFCTTVSINDAVKKGRKIWYYNYPTALERGKFIRNRLFPWQVYANRGEGALLWQITNVSSPKQNPWRDIADTYNCGQATLIYPALTSGGKFHRSRRFALIREGIDDFDYLKMLEEKIERHFPGHGTRRVSEMAGKLLPQLPFDYVNDAQVLAEVRRQAADELENYAAAPFFLITSNPGDNGTTTLPTADFTIYGPAGAEVRHSGTLLGTIDDRPLKVTLPLKKLGENSFMFTCGQGAAGKIFRRTVTLQYDPVLRKLAELAAKGANDRITAFLKKTSAGYDREMRAEAARLLYAEQKRAIGEKLSSKADTEPLNRVFPLTLQAKFMYDKGLFERAAYYLRLRENYEALPHGTAGDAVKLRPVIYNGMLGFELSNDRLRALIVENGGKIVSFKLRGVECFDQSKTTPVMPPEKRAVMPENFAGVPYREMSGGFGDVIGFFPEGSYDWDVTGMSVNAKQVTLKLTCRFSKGMYRLERTAILNAASQELQLKYRIVNLADPEYISDDPSAYLVRWRGKVFAGIGGKPQHDRMVLPSGGRDYDGAKYFEQLWCTATDKNGVRAVDEQAGVAITLRGDAKLDYGYVWCNNTPGGNMPSGYTLELPRSGYGNSEAGSRNRPFDIRPGMAETFECVIAAEFIR